MVNRFLFFVTTVVDVVAVAAAAVSSMIGYVPSHSLDLYKNELAGSIPSQIGLLSKLINLDLSENSFDGELPAPFLSMTNLEKIHLHQTDGGLHGTLPAFHDFPRLHELFLDNNLFSGQMPSNFLAGVTDKTRNMKVTLTSNKISGAVPVSLQDFTRMDLWLEDNEITSIPPELCAKSEWMGGEVGDQNNSCDAILCPIGFYNTLGKAFSQSGSQCQVCQAAQFMGSTECGNQNGGLPTERHILDRLYTSTGGRDWKKFANWRRPSAPICSREGVTCAGGATAETGVQILRLNSFGLQGEIPSDVFLLPDIELLGFTDNEVTIDLQGIDKATKLRVLQLSASEVSDVAFLDMAPDSLVELHLASTKLTGTFPSELLELSALELLLSSTVPTEITKMSALMQLWLAGSGITGLIPTEIGAMQNLQRLDLAKNYLSGNLPTELENLSNLDVLLLNAQQSADKLSGGILSFASNTKLTDIDLSNNNFKYIIPGNFLASVDQTARVTMILSGNSLTGEIPTDFALFQDLYLDATNNMISVLSTSLCENNNNKWMGNQVGSFGCDAIMCPRGTAALQGRQIKDSEPCVACPNGIADAPYMGSVACIPNRDSHQKTILMELYDNLNGTDWRDQTNWGSDKSICTWYGVNCTDDGNGVVGLHLQNNGLDANGDVTSLFFELPYLETLDIKGNRVPLDFTKIPPNNRIKILQLSATGLLSLFGISRATDLRRLHVVDNTMTGTIPDELFRLTQLRSLYLSFNQFSGTLSSDLGKLSNLQEFYMFGNSITGTIPQAAIPKLSKLVEFIMPENFLEGTIPDAFSSLSALEQLSLYDQKGFELITGPIPDFANAPSLWYFDVSNNDLTGPIPSNFMTNSEYKTDAVTIYLTSNDITGTVPEALDEFDDMDLDITGNHITGLSTVFCDNDEWMQGKVGEIGGCDAIVCPPGTYTRQGRQVSASNPCESCNFLQGSNEWGSKVCADVTVERTILMEFYTATNGPLWADKTNWGSNTPICSWAGVLCQDGDRGDTSGVTSLVLADNNMFGTMPASVWSLPFLRSLDLKENIDLHVNFEGLDDVESLRLMYLSGTRVDSLEGISGAPFLRELHITDCDLTGTLPNDVYDLESLEQIYLAYNYFDGTLSPRIGELVNLTDFYAYNNEFSGPVPSEIGELEYLESMGMFLSAVRLLGCSFVFVLVLCESRTRT